MTWRRIFVLAAALLLPVQGATQPRECYGLLKFSEQLSPERRAELAGDGIVILSHFQDSTYRVRLPTCSSRVPGRVGTFVLLTPQDRVAPEIREGRYDLFDVALPDASTINTVVNEDGSLSLTVTFYQTVPAAQIDAALQAVDARLVRRTAENRRSVRLLPDSVPALARWEVVEWIDADPKRVVPDAQTTRRALRIDTVQRFDVTLGVPAGLGGREVKVAIFDAGIDEEHGDFAGRMAYSYSDVNYHGTHVAGIVAGGGNLSTAPDAWGNPNGGGAYEWRGMAPLAQLLEASMDWGGDVFSHKQYVQEGMHLSNHSYPMTPNGIYDESTQTYDRLIRGDLVAGGDTVPPRLQVHSAGNNGEFAQFGAQVGYFSLTRQVKNAVVVGNYYLAPDTARISPSSSLGPTHDGRIKPDVVAPGTGVLSTGFCLWSYRLDEEWEGCKDEQTGARRRRNYYRQLTGTSMAAPAVTGVLALVLEQYARSYGVDLSAGGPLPLPSTLRAIVIHTADDIVSNGPWFANADAPVQAFPGPDFVTGWGMVNAEEAVKVVREHAIVEGALTLTCDSVAFPLEVAADAPLRVTLAWDDAGGQLPRASLTDPVLVNDLDLVLVDPMGEVHRPWLLDQVAHPTARVDDLSPEEAAAGLPDDAQTCGTPLRIERRVQPTDVPVFSPWTPDANRNDLIEDGALRPAGRGRDHLNNVEQVFVASPRPGTWRVWVVGFDIPEGPQRFSLVGVAPLN